MIFVIVLYLIRSNWIDRSGHFSSECIGCCAYELFMKYIEVFTGNNEIYKRHSSCDRLLKTADEGVVYWSIRKGGTCLSQLLQGVWRSAKIKIRNKNMKKCKK
jgi:hypothetical protein